MAQSLFRACKNIYRLAASGVQPVGDYEISFEYYNQKSIDDNVEAIAKGEATECTFGDSDENKVVLVVDDTITIPSSFTLAPAHPKKSLVIMCNTLVNNGTISMTAKGPNVLPHNWFILGKSDNYGDTEDIIIPAYANNSVSGVGGHQASGNSGNNGTNRQCGSGGSGSQGWRGSSSGASGSGYAFGGGAGSGGGAGDASSASVDTTYPMRGTDGVYGWPGVSTTQRASTGGVGNPPGISFPGDSGSHYQNSGVGGRVIIYCNTFENNGTISANGVSDYGGGPAYDSNSRGGSSGGGAIDIFYTNMIIEGTNTANGGPAVRESSGDGWYSGKGGDGSITLLNWTIDKIVKAQRKMFTRDNWLYLFSEYVSELNESEAL